MPRLNILHLADFRWYNATAHYALTIAQALAQRGHKVCLGLTSKQNLPDIACQENALKVLEVKCILNGPVSLIESIRDLSGFVRGEQIQIVNAHSASSHVLAALVKRITNSKFRLVRTRGEACAPKRNFFDKYLYSRLTDQVIVPAHVLVEQYTKVFDLKSDRIGHIPLGIRQEDVTSTVPITSWREKLGIPAEEKVVGMVGRLSPVKGHIYFIQGAQIVLKKLPCTTFVIAGQAAQISPDRLKRLAHRLGVIDKFIFLGTVEDVSELVSIFDLGVVCSTGSETICRVLLEYMRAGKPVVGTIVNGIPDVIEDGKNGYLVGPADSQRLASAIIKILGEDQLRLKMGNHSRNLIQTDFSLEKFAEKTEDVYLKLLD